VVSGCTNLLRWMLVTSTPPGKLKLLGMQCRDTTEQCLSPRPSARDHVLAALLRRPVSIFPQAVVLHYSMSLEPRWLRQNQPDVSSPSSPFLVNDVVVMLPSAVIHGDGNMAAISRQHSFEIGGPSHPAILLEYVIYQALRPGIEFSARDLVDYLGVHISYKTQVNVCLYEMLRAGIVRRAEAVSPHGARVGPVWFRELLVIPGMSSFAKDYGVENLFPSIDYYCVHRQITNLIVHIGMFPSTVESLLLFLELTPIDVRLRTLTSKLCSICFEEDTNRLLKSCLVTPCSHFFHLDCASDWFDHRDTCPNCRAIVDVVDFSNQPEATLIKIAIKCNRPSLCPDIDDFSVPSSLTGEGLASAIDAEIGSIGLSFDLVYCPTNRVYPVSLPMHHQLDDSGVKNGSVILAFPIFTVRIRIGLNGPFFTLTIRSTDLVNCVLLRLQRVKHGSDRDLHLLGLLLNPIRRICDYDIFPDCIIDLVPKGTGHGGYAAIRVGDASHPGPDPFTTALAAFNVPAITGGLMSVVQFAVSTSGYALTAIGHALNVASQAAMFMTAHDWLLYFSLSSGVVGYTYYTLTYDDSETRMTGQIARLCMNCNPTLPHLQVTKPSVVSRVLVPNHCDECARLPDLHGMSEITVSLDL